MCNIKLSIRIICVIIHDLGSSKFMNVDIFRSSFWDDEGRWSDDLPVVWLNYRSARHGLHHEEAMRPHTAGRPTGIAHWTLSVGKKKCGCIWSVYTHIFMCIYIYICKNKNYVYNSLYTYIYIYVCRCVCICVNN